MHYKVGKMLTVKGQREYNILVNKHGILDSTYIDEPDCVCLVSSE